MITILTKKQAMEKLSNLEDTNDVYVIVYANLVDHYYMLGLREASFNRINKKDVDIVYR